uniref:Putative polyprotein n=1 Tax=Albugo laibachii Nc14 TaxID=890382 RepID=F0X287_9STRA|nr:putative polyprotein [Albugo laibachii Nc14]|eukprot:CCA27966.1 putative polyprotein [Albugo laibachii Nc14]
MLPHKNVDKVWRAEGVNTAAYITNFVKCRNRSNTTLIDTCFEAKPELSQLRVFEFAGFADMDKSKRSNLDAKAYPCLFLGYANDSKEYRVFKKLTKRVEISRSIQLMDDIETIYVQVIDQSPTIIHETVFINDDASECQV